jgi:hypothetical protein
MQWGKLAARLFRHAISAAPNCQNAMASSSLASNVTTEGCFLDMNRPSLQIMLLCLMGLLAAAFAVIAALAHPLTKP